MQLSRLITETDPDLRVSQAYDLLNACEQDSPIYDYLMQCVENTIVLVTEALIVSDAAAEQHRGKIHQLRELATFREDLAKYARTVIDNGENA